MTNKNIWHKMSYKREKERWSCIAKIVTENPDKALFCKECGAKLNEEDTVKYATASNLPASSKKKFP